jgi:hypothetical protein
VNTINLNSDDYLKDFYSEYNTIKRQLYKLEVGQSFMEPDNDSWVLANNGDWDEAMRIAQNDGEADNKRADPPAPSYRVRIFELPLTPYLIWELNYLKYRNRFVNNCRFLCLSDVPKDLKLLVEKEIVTIDTNVLYEVHYTASGELAGATKETDLKTISDVVKKIEQLYEIGITFDDFAEYYLSKAPIPTTLTK